MNESSESAKSCSRIWAPSLRWKLRTQPTWSAASPPSIKESATAGCQASWLLKSRSTAQTRSIGASMMADRVTRCIGSALAEIALQGVEPGLKYALADILGKLSFLARRRFELRPPFRKGTIAVGYRCELERRHVVLHTHRRFQDRVGALVVVIGKRQ